MPESLRRFIAISALSCPTIRSGRAVTIRYTVRCLTLLGGDDGGRRMGMIGVLTFLARPDRAATHTLTVTLTSVDGERYSACAAVALE